MEAGWPNQRRVRMIRSEERMTEARPEVLATPAKAASGMGMLVSDSSTELDASPWLFSAWHSYFP